MTRPPFAELSALAIRELNAWIARQALWSQRLHDVLDEHVLPAASELASAARKYSTSWTILQERRGAPHWKTYARAGMPILQRIWSKIF